MSEQVERAMLLEVRQLHAKVADLVDEQRHLLRALLAGPDRRAGVVLLPLVAELVGDGAFTATSLLRGAMNDRTPTGQAARDVLGDLTTEAGGLRAFGRLLARLQGVPLAGYRLVPDGEASEGRRWRMQRVSEGE
jgi:hypothetical protein